MPTPTPIQTPNQKTSPSSTTSSPRPDTRLFDRPLPHSEEAERGMLGSMLLQKEVIGEVVTALESAGSAALFNERHRLLYDVLVELYDQDKLVDDIVIKNELDQRGLFEKLGGFDFLTRLAGSVPSAMRARHYADIVRDKFLLRELVSAAHRVIETTLDSKLPPAELLDLAEKEIFDVTERRAGGGAADIRSLLEEAVKQINARIREKKVLTGLRTGFEQLDELTSGLQRGELIIVAARPSMGKTALGLNMAENIACVDDTPVLFFSLEMSQQQVAERILCSHGRVDSHKLRRLQCGPADLERLTAASKRLASKPLYIDDTSQLSILELRARARMNFRKHDIQAIIVDYLQLMTAPGTESRQVEVANISRGLKALAKELKIPVVAMAQLNRSPEDRGRQGSRPRMSDLRESGAIEQDADVVMLLHREAYYKAPSADEDPQQAAAAHENEGKTDLIIAKQRNGPTGTVKLHWHKQYTRFENPSFGDDPGYPDAGDAGGFMSDDRPAFDNPETPF